MRQADGARRREQGGSLGESEAWEAAYQQTRRSLAQRRARLGFFDPVGPGDRVVDLAAGDGLDMQILAETGARLVVGLDISPRLLARARGARVVADAHRMPFADASLDAVVANSVLHHFDPPVAVREIGRALKPGGRLLMMEPRPCLLRSLLDWVTLSFAPSQLVPLFRARRTALLEELDVYSRWLSVYPELAGWLGEAGMVLDRGRHTAFGILAQWRKTTR